MIVVREAKIKDAPGIAKVHVDTRRITYKGIIPDDHLLKRTYEDTENRWANMISSPQIGEFVFVAEKNEREIVGFASTLDNNKGGGFDSILSTLYISKDYQRQGIGQSLVMSAVSKLKEQHVKSMIVWVFSENPSRKFYERLGGKLVKEKMVNEGKDILEVAYGWDDIEKLESFT